MEKKQWIVLRLLEKVFSFSKRRFLCYCTCIWYLINFSILSRLVPIFSCFFYLLFICYLTEKLIKKGLVVETSLVLKYILPYYFYLVHVIYYFCLAKINLFISIPYPNQVYAKQKKAFLSGDLCVLYSVML